MTPFARLAFNDDWPVSKDALIVALGRSKSSVGFENDRG